MTSTFLRVFLVEVFGSDAPKECVDSKHAEQGHAESAVSLSFHLVTEGLLVQTCSIEVTISFI
jgi:hypothetical protein